MIKFILENTLGSSLFVLAVAGLSFLAYWEPIGFRKLHNYLWPSLLLIYLFYFTYSIGAMNARSAMLPYVSIEKFDEARAAAGSDFGAFSYLWFGLLFYLGFLRWLGPMLGRAPKEGGIFIGIVPGEETKDRHGKK